MIRYVVPLVTALLPSVHNTTALGEASLTQLILTTILPLESTVVLTAGRKLAGLPGRENTHSRSCVHLKEIIESFRLTCSNVTITLFNWVVCNACDSFPIECIYGRDIHTQETISTARVAQNREGKLSQRSSCQPLTLVLQFSIIYWLHRAHRGTQWSLCWKRTFIKY